MVMYAELLYQCDIRVPVVLGTFAKCCYFGLCRGFCAGAGAIAGTATAGAIIAGNTAADATYGRFNDPARQ